MRIVDQALDGLFLLEPRVIGDERGWFFESFNQQRFTELTGHPRPLVQDNHSRSAQGVLRGIHFQAGAAAQGKLVRATHGEIFDVAVDLRRGSATFGQWRGYRLNAENHQQLWVPPGFGHAFLVTSDVAEVQYKVDAYWSPQHEHSLLWSDTQLAIDWPQGSQPQLSGKDAVAPTLDSLLQRGLLFD